MLLRLPRPSNQFNVRISHISQRYKYSTQRAGHDLDEAKLAAARKWLSDFDGETIPRSIGDVTFSRSSGPGGQNVNKVSSKATLRVSLSSILPLIPELLHPSLKSSRYVAPRTDDLVIQADEARKQTDNINACYRKLNEMVRDFADQCIPGETSAAQSARVKQLQKAEDAARRKMKDVRSSKKAARRGPSE